MSMNWDFQQAFDNTDSGLWNIWHVVDETPMLFKRLRVRSKPKWPTWELCAPDMTLYWSWVRVNFSITFAEKIAFSENSLGESFMLLRHSRDIESAISIDTPETNSKLKEYSDRAMYHRTIIGFEYSVMYKRLRWSVRNVNLRSRNSDFKCIHT